MASFKEHSRMNQRPTYSLTPILGSTVPNLQQGAFPEDTRNLHLDPEATSLFPLLDRWHVNSHVTQRKTIPRSSSLITEPPRIRINEILVNPKDDVNAGERVPESAFTDRPYQKPAKQRGSRYTYASLVLRAAGFRSVEDTILRSTASGRPRRLQHTRRIVIGSGRTLDTRNKANRRGDGARWCHLPRPLPADIKGTLASTDAAGRPLPSSMEKHASRIPLGPGPWRRRSVRQWQQMLRSQVRTWTAQPL